MLRKSTPASPPPTPKHLTEEEREEARSNILGEGISGNGEINSAELKHLKRLGADFSSSRSRPIEMTHDRATPITSSFPKGVSVTQHHCSYYSF